MEELHIGKMIQAELKAQERSVTWLANHIPCHRTNVYKIFSNGNIDLKMLTRISEVLDHNFLMDCATLFDKKRESSQQEA
jgi:hypothetical protein